MGASWEEEDVEAAPANTVSNRSGVFASALRRAHIFSLSSVLFFPWYLPIASLCLKTRQVSLFTWARPS